MGLLDSELSIKGPELGLLDLELGLLRLPAQGNYDRSSKLSHRIEIVGVLLCITYLYGEFIDQIFKGQY